jgi:hypothetical protein
MMEVTRMAKPSLYGSIVSSLLLLAACDGVQPCAVPGSVEACACAPGMPGARVCEGEHTWGECDCSGAIPLPNPVTPITGGSGGMSGGAGGAGVGGSGAGGAGGSGGMSGGAGGAGVGGDDDGGVEPDAGGSGGIGGSGGMGGMEPENPYGACMNNGDCQPTADCSITPNFPTDASVCAPKCMQVSECPVPEGTYEAMVQCVTGYCRIDCTPVLFEPLLSCPRGMVCINPLFGQSYCHDDGM